MNPVNRMLSVLPAWLILSLLFLFTACHDDDVAPERIEFSNNNPIADILDTEPSYNDTLYFALDGVDYKIPNRGTASTRTDKGISGATFLYGNSDGNIDFDKRLSSDFVIAPSFYYPSDSSFLNNRDYLNTFPIIDGGNEIDLNDSELNHIYDVFKLFVKVFDSQARQYYSIAETSTKTYYSKVSLIKYRRPNWRWSEFRVRVEFRCRVRNIDDSNDTRDITGHFESPISTNGR